MTIDWQPVQGTEGIEEVPISRIVPLEHVMQCCETPEIWFVCVSPPESATCWFHLACRACGRTSEDTKRSWGRAIAEWNIPLWNPRYMGRKPLKLADRIEALLKQKLSTLQDVASVLEAMRQAPAQLRNLVRQAEENELKQYVTKDE